MSKVWFCHLISYKNNNGLKKTLCSFGSYCYTFSVFILLCNFEHDPHKNDQCQKHLNNIAGKREVINLYRGIDLFIIIDGKNLLSTEFFRIKFSFPDVFIGKYYIVLICFFPMMKFRGHKNIKSSLCRVNNYRKWYADWMNSTILFFDIQEMEFLGIQHMAKDNFLGVKCFFFSGIRTLSLTRKNRAQKGNKK